MVALQVWYGGKYSKCKSANVPDEAKSALAHRDKALLNLYYVHFDNTVDKKDTDVYRDLCMLNMNAVCPNKHHACNLFLKCFRMLAPQPVSMHAS